jgi:hypothetical protein
MHFLRRYYGINLFFMFAARTARDGIFGPLHPKNHQSRMARHMDPAKQRTIDTWRKKCMASRGDRAACHVDEVETRRSALQIIDVLAELGSKSDAHVLRMVLNPEFVSVDTAAGGQWYDLKHQ